MIIIPERNDTNCRGIILGVTKVERLGQYATTPDEREVEINMGKISRIDSESTQPTYGVSAAFRELTFFHALCITGYL